MDTLTYLPFLRQLAPEQVRWLESLFTPCNYEADTVIFQQGEQAECMYLVLSGEVIVRYKPEDGPALLVTRVQPGGVVGWSAALHSRLYTSSALTDMNTHLLRARGADLRSVCEHDPELGQLILDWLASLIAERLKSTHAQVLALLQLGLGSSIQVQER